MVSEFKLESIEKLRDQAKRSKNLSYQDVLDRLDEIQSEVDERFIERPSDVFNIPWRFIDEKFEHDGETYTLMHMACYGERLWKLVGMQESSGECHGFFAYECRHVKPRMVEDVLNDYRSECELLLREFERADVSKEEYRQGLIDINARYAAELMLCGDA